MNKKIKLIWPIKMVCLFLFLLTIAAPLWVPYLLGCGGHEQLVITLFLVIVGVVIVSIVLVVWGIFKILYCLFRRHPIKVSHAPSFLLALIVIVSVFMLPNIIAEDLKRLGANHRLEQLGGALAYEQIIKASQELFCGSESIRRDELPEVFRCLGVVKVVVYKGADPHIDAPTSGRPFHTGWGVYSNTIPQDGSKRKGVEVRPGLYRY